MHGQNRQSQDESDDRVSRLVTRLQDLLVEEISTVDRAANKRRFLVVKTEGDDMPTGEEVFEQDDGTMTTDAFGTVEAAANASDDTSNGETIDGTDKATPANVKAAVVGMLEGAGGKLDALIAKLKEAKGFIPPPLLLEAKAIVTVLRGVSSRYPSPKAKSEGEPVEAAATDDSDVATDDATEVTKANAAAAATALAAARAKIAPLVAKVKALEEGDGSLPGDIGKMIDEIAMAIETGLGLAKTEKAEPGESEGDSEQPGDMSAAHAVVEAAKLLHVALGKLAAGKPCDDESLRMVAKARDMLATAAKAKAKARKADDEPNDDEPTDGDREPTAKAGTKQLSRARREQFKGALDALLKLFEEMIPEAERKSMWPTRKAATPEPEPVEKSDDEDPAVVELRKAVEERDAKIAKLQGVIKDRDDEPGDSNLVPVGKGLNENGETRAVWEHDLNEPDTDAPW